MDLKKLEKTLDLLENKLNEINLFRKLSDSELKPYVKIIKNTQYYIDSIKNGYDIKIQINDNAINLIKQNPGIKEKKYADKFNFIVNNPTSYKKVQNEVVDFIWKEFHEYKDEFFKEIKDITKKNKINLRINFFIKNDLQITQFEFVDESLQLMYNDVKNFIYNISNSSRDKNINFDTEHNRVVVTVYDLIEKYYDGVNDEEKFDSKQVKKFDNLFSKWIKSQTWKSKVKHFDMTISEKGMVSFIIDLK